MPTMTLKRWRAPKLGYEEATTSLRKLGYVEATTSLATTDCIETCKGGYFSQKTYRLRLHELQFFLQQLLPEHRFVIQDGAFIQIVLVGPETPQDIPRNVGDPYNSLRL